MHGVQRRLHLAQRSWGERFRVGVYSQTPIRMADPPIAPVSRGSGRGYCPVDERLHYRAQLRVLGLQLGTFAERRERLHAEVLVSANGCRICQARDVQQEVTPQALLDVPHEGAADGIEQL